MDVVVVMGRGILAHFQISGTRGHCIYMQYMDR
ncbi:hypothetical protein ACVWZ3_008597 [Bradyrhizobium sp. i1.3.6]